MTKPSSNWRTFVDLKNLELCDVLRGKHMIGLINRYFSLLRQLVPGLIPRPCPVAIGKYCSNNTIINYNVSYEEFRSSFTTTILPNGLYRVFLRFKTYEDPKGFSFWLNFEYYVWHNNGSLI